MPRGEDRQRAEQADPGPCRAGLSLRPVQARQLVGAGRGEHVACPADQFGDDAVVQAERAEQLGILTCEDGGVVIGEDSRRVRPPDQVVLGVGNDRVDGVLLGRGGRSQVMVALDLRAVIGVDRRPSPACPGALIAQGQVRGPDPGPVDLQRPAVIAGHVMPQRPAPDSGPSGLPDERAPAGAAGAQPQTLAVVRGGEASQQR